MNRFPMKTLIGCVAAGAALSTAGTVMAVPYASAVVQTGNTVDFILNETADTVTVTRDGGSALVLTGTAGAKSFDMTGFTDYSIEVGHTAAAGWVESSSSIANSAFLNFERPNAVKVNNNPGSANFGNIYVGNRSTLPAASGRLMGDGIYILNATGLNSGGELVDDTTAAKNGGDGLAFTASSNSPWRMSIGADDNLYIADWSDATGGVKVMTPDGSSISLLLDTAGGPTGGIVGGNHGSVVSRPVVTGSLGTDLTLWTMDEDLEGSVAGTGNHIWRYDVGTDTSNHTGAATLVVDASTEGTNSDGTIILFDLNIGVDADINRDHVSGNWIITQPRNDGNETGLLILGEDVNGNPDPTNVLFNSKQFSIDNGLDGATDDILFPEFDGNQDIFRFISRAEVSPDGSTLALHRRSQGAENPYLGLEPVILIPLDGSGVPVLDLSDTVGNPGLGVTEIAMVSQSNGSRKTLSYDLAGNLYAGSNADEQVTIWGPGGVSTAVTASDGTFTINGVTYGGGDPCGLTGDLNCDGFVGIDDLNIVLGAWNQNVPPANPLADPSGDGFVGIDDLNQVLGNWNAGTPPTAGAVPEPTTLALLGLGGFAMLRRRR